MTNYSYKVLQRAVNLSLFVTVKYDSQWQQYRQTTGTESVQFVSDGAKKSMKVAAATVCRR